MSLSRRAFTISMLALVIVSIATSVLIGGDAFQGHAEHGHYFVREHANSPEHEVSRAIYLLSLWEMRILFAAWAVAMVASILRLAREI